MVALVVSLLGALALGLTGWVPSLLGRDSGVQDVRPGLLTVEPDVKGVATVGSGRAASLYSSGLRLLDGDAILLQTVISGSLVSVVTGSVTGSGARRIEHVETVAPNLAVDDLALEPPAAVYSGAIGPEAPTRPVRVTVRYEGDVVRLVVTAPGADAIVVHLLDEPLTVGQEPQLPAVNLQRKAWWLRSGASGSDPAFSTFLRTSVAVGPAGVDRAVDLRQRGRTDIHVWSDHAVLTVTSRPRDAVRDS